MFAIMEKELRNSLQDRGLLFWMLILPIIFTVLFISMFTTNVTGDEKGQVIISIVPGYVVMFVFFIMISIVHSFLKDRDNGLVARLASTPLQPFPYLLGKWMPFMMIVCVQIAVLLLVGKVIYHIPFTQPLYIIGIAILLSIVTTALGVALALFVKTENMGIALTQIIALGGAIVGGLWMPLEMMPSFMQTAAKFLPQYWAHEAFQAALVGELTFSGFMQFAGVLLAISVGAILLAVLRYPVYLQQARN